MLDEKDSAGKYTERAALLRFLVIDDGTVTARIMENERLRTAFDAALTHVYWHSSSCSHYGPCYDNAKHAFAQKLFNAMHPEKGPPDDQK